jgi:hypothetical protein
LPCQEHLVEVRDHRAAIEALGATVIAAGFSPAPALAELASYLDWPWPFLSDRERRLYRRLGLPRVAPWHVYTPGTLLRYGRALVTGHAIRKPVEDTRQLGGDAVVRAGKVVRLFRTTSPDDRAPVSAILDALRQAART